VTQASIPTSVAAVVFTAAILFAGGAHAQAPQPIGVSSVGPWEIVVWGVGKRVQQCTLIRAKDNAGAGYGFLIDQRGLIASIESNKWKLTAGKATPVMFSPAKGKPRNLNAMPVSPERANVDLPANDPLLGELQASDSATVRIGAVTLKLPFDDFNAARVTFEICVQSLGKDWKQP
jgi:hypothetical protein